MGCNVKQNLLIDNDLKRDVKSIIEEMNVDEWKNGEIVHRTTKRYFELNEKGNIIEMSESTQYDSDESIFVKYTYTYENEYDEEGNRIENIRCNSDGEIEWKSTYEYDEEGNLIEKIDYRNDGSGLFNLKFTYEYDEEGNIRYEIKYDEDGNADLTEYHYTYKYDGDWPNQVEKITYNADGTVSSKYTYEFDEKGSLLFIFCDEPYARDVRYTYGGGLVVGPEILTLEPSGIGNKVEQIYYESDGSVFVKYTYEYDAEGNLVEEIKYVRGSFSVKHTYEYEYDEEKNWTRKIYFEDDVAYKIREREYEYYNH